MNTELVEWQKLAPNGLVYPWWVHPMLEHLETLDWQDKTMLEFGAGLGTAWLRDKCKWVDSIDANPEWADRANQYCDGNRKFNGEIFCKQLNEGDQQTKQMFFDLIPKDKKYGIVSVDSIHRNECLQWALDHFKGRGGLLIADNFDQDFVWISPAADALMLPYKSVEKIFYQPDHTNHEGKKWNTRLWEIKP